MKYFKNLCRCRHVLFSILNEGRIFHVAGGSGDAGAGASAGAGTSTGTGNGTLTIVASGRGAARGKRILPADIFVTKPNHIENKKG